MRECRLLVFVVTVRHFLWCFCGDCCGVFVVLLWCLNGALVVPLWCHRGAFVVPLWCLTGATVVL